MNAPLDRSLNSRLVGVYTAQNQLQRLRWVFGRLPPTRPAPTDARGDDSSPPMIVLLRASAEYAPGRGDRLWPVFLLQSRIVARIN